MVCAVARRDCGFSSLVARPLGLSCGFSPTSACRPPTEVCSQGYPRAHESAWPGGATEVAVARVAEIARGGWDRVQKRSQRPPGLREPQWGWGSMGEPFLMSGEAGASVWGDSDTSKKIVLTGFGLSMYVKLEEKYIHILP